MLDNAQLYMANGSSIAIEQISGVNDNMSRSHYHEYYELYFLDSGERFHLMDSSIYHASAGDILLFPPLTMHHSYGEKDVSFSRIVLYFTDDVIKYPVIREFLAKGPGIYRPTEHALHGIRRYMFSLLEEQNKHTPFQQERLSAFLNVLLFQLMDIPSSPNEQKGKTGTNRIQQVLEYINANLHNEITLKDLAARFYVSPYYLCREFKKYTNSTIISYLNRSRVMTAQKLFQETYDNVTKVCSQSGFSNLTHFNRVFKEMTGMSPSVYRQNHLTSHKSKRISG